MTTQRSPEEIAAAKQAYERATNEESMINMIKSF